mmetsp:Transcript_45461/g.176782  ORF Transcript_45461/g.176782 Transcript_45461/m.176782 type:complete len:108 (-) Transcript_45461:423-746(-)
MSSFLVVRRFAVSGVRSNSRSMCTIASGSLGGKWKDKEAAQENMYFNKEEEKVLKNLADKLSRHHTPTPEQLEAQASELDNILKKHGVDTNDSLKDDILAFKYGKHD